MDAVAGMSFRDPLVLWSLLLLVPAAWFLRRRDLQRRKLANRFVAERVRGQLQPLRSLRPALLTLATALIIVSLAGPQFGAADHIVEAPESSLVVLLDTSLSMATPDVGTSRLAGARAVIQKVLEGYDGRAGLIVFEGASEVVAPLTDDTMAIATLLESVGTAELEIAGSNLRLAITGGLELLDRSNVTAATLLLISDGEHRAEDLRDVLDQARERDIPIVTVMIGTEQGATIPTGDGEPLQVNGETVVSRAREEILSGIAARTGGRFVANPFSQDAVDQLVDAVNERAWTSEGQARVRVPKSRYQIPLSVALLLLLTGSVLHRGAE